MYIAVHNSALQVTNSQMIFNHFNNLLAGFLVVIVNPIISQRWKDTMYVS